MANGRFSILLLGAVACLAGVGVTQYIISARSRVIDVVAELKSDVLPAAQLARERRFKRVGDREFIRRLDGIRRPGNLRVTDDGGILVFDWDAMRLMRFSQEGILKSTFAGRPTKPGSTSLDTPTDYDVSLDGQVWIADPRRRNLIVFAPGGEQLRTLETEGEVANLVHLSNGNVAVLPGGVTPHLLEIRDGSTGRPLTFAGHFLQNWERDSVSLSGAILGIDGRRGIVFAANYMGILVAFEQDGHLRYLRETIDRTPPPLIQITRQGAQRIPSTAKRAMLNFSVVGPAIVIAAPTDTGSLVALDFYDADTGTYQHSVEGPDDPEIRRVYVSGDMLYTATRNTVSVWRQRGLGATAR
jgi:hypothetical protein